ncbi:MAG: NifU family protein [Parcubacteria group bacterium]|nr:NifU family protein [Parcubacteria group bacterium]
MTERLKQIDFSNLKEKYRLTALYFITPLFDDQGLHITELIFGLRILPNTKFFAEQKIKDAIKTLLPPEYMGAEITLFPSAESEVDSIMDWSIRPYAHGHGGDIALDSIREKEGVVVVTLVGSCGSCPSALGTMRYGVESLLKGYLPWMKRAEATNLPEEPDFDVHW